MSSCPLCCSLKWRLLKSIEVEQVVASWQSFHKIDVRPELGDVSMIELRECVDCSLQFYRPEGLDGSPALYARLEDFDWYYRPWRWEYETALEDLRGCRRIIEIGCGAGHFLAMARKRDGLEVEGLEQNPRAVEEGREEGLLVGIGTVEQAAEHSKGQYDAVCSFQVLEHVSSPRTFLAGCCDLLKSGGRLILGLPNADGFLRHLFRVFDMPPHHLSRWPLKAVSGLPRFFPLQLKRMKIEPLADCDVEDYVYTYSSLLARGPLCRLKPFAVRGLSSAIKQTGFGRFLHGHSVYACFVRA